MGIRWGVARGAFGGESYSIGSGFVMGWWALRWRVGCATPPQRGFVSIRRAKVLL